MCLHSDFIKSAVSYKIKLIYRGEKACLRRQVQFGLVLYKQREIVPRSSGNAA